jgi:hypothetical protein
MWPGWPKLNRRRAVTVLLGIAAFLALAASAYLLVTPVQIHELVAVSAENGATQTSTIRQASWYQVQGAWGVIFVSLLAGLYGLTAVLNWADRGWTTIGTGTVAVALTLLASLSVGSLYYPAMLFVLLAGAVGLVGLARAGVRSSG